MSAHCFVIIAKYISWPLAGANHCSSQRCDPWTVKKVPKDFTTLLCWSQNHCPKSHVTLKRCDSHDSSESPTSQDGSFPPFLGCHNRASHPCWPLQSRSALTLPKSFSISPWMSDLDLSAPPPSIWHPHSRSVFPHPCWEQPLGWPTFLFWSLSTLCQLPHTLLYNLCLSFTHLL